MTTETNAAAPTLDELFEAYGNAYHLEAEGIDWRDSAEKRKQDVIAALLRAGAAKVPDLHDAIMNLPCDDSKANEEYNDRRSAYKHGHRDARHAAAELAITTPPAPDAGVVAAECEEVCVRIAVTHQQAEGTYAAGKKAGALECADTIRQRFGVGE